MNHLFPKYTPHPDLAGLFAFQTLRAVLPVASVATLLSAVAIVALHNQTALSGHLYMLLPLLVLAGLYAYLSHSCLPVVTQPGKADGIAAIATTATALVMSSGALTSHSFSPLPIALLVLISTTLYNSNRNFALFAVFAIGADIASQYLAGSGITASHYLALILVPTFALMMRISLTYMQRQTNQMRLALESKLTELEAEKALRAEIKAQLLQAQKSGDLGQVATGVAHDFNNYLYVISLMAEDLLIDDPTSQKLAIILSSTKEASSVCDRMLSDAGVEPKPPTNDNAARTQKT